jgi:hypothetical protein
MADDWSVHLLQLAARGELGRVSRSLYLDLPALAQAWTCATGACTPGQRVPDARSCCADLEVTPTDAERAAIEAALPEIASFLASRDPRWATPQAPFDGDALRRPSRRCVFALPPTSETPGLSCALHALEDATGRPRGALKPLPCRLFPLVIVDAEEGRTLLTAVSRRTWRLAGSRPARAFPCLGAPGAPTVAEACADTITALYGAKAAKAVAGAAATWRAQAG